MGINGDIGFLLQPEEKCVSAVEKVLYCHRHTPRSTSHNLAAGVIENLHMQGVLLPRPLKSAQVEVAFDFYTQMKS